MNTQLLEKRKKILRFFEIICFLIQIPLLYFGDKFWIIYCILLFYITIYLASLDSMRFNLPHEMIKQILLLINENQILLDEKEYQKLFKHNINDFTTEFVKMFNKHNNEIVIYLILRCILFITLVLILIGKYINFMKIQLRYPSNLNLLILLCVELMIFYIIGEILRPRQLKKLFKYIVKALTDQSNQASLEIIDKMLVPIDNQDIVNAIDNLSEPSIIQQKLLENKTDQQILDNWKKQANDQKKDPNAIINQLRQRIYMKYLKKPYSSK